MFYYYFIVISLLFFAYFLSTHKMEDTNMEEATTERIKVEEDTKVEMEEEINVNVNIENKKKRKAPKCSTCKTEGHNKRNCPSNETQPTQTRTRTQAQTQTQKSKATTKVDPKTLSDCLYCVIDLETSGYGIAYHRICQFAACLVNENGEILFEIEKKVNPEVKIDKKAEEIHHLSNKDLEKFPNFKVQGQESINFWKKTDKQVILVSHSASTIDLPFLLNEFQLNELVIPENVQFVMDTLSMSKYLLKEVKNYKLSTIIEFIDGKEMEKAHDALEDARALITLLKYPGFLEERFNFIKPFKHYQTLLTQQKSRHLSKTQTQTQTGNESETGTETKNDTQTQSKNENENEAKNETKTKTQTELKKDKSSWKKINYFQPLSPFKGLSPGPKIARQFKNAKNSFLGLSRGLLELIVVETNRYAKMKRAAKIIHSYYKFRVQKKKEKKEGKFIHYERLKLRPWSDLTMKELKNFISILILAGIHNRYKDVESWWSKDPFLNFPIVSTLMTGQRFSINFF